VGRPRVIVASSDAEAAVKLVAALNPQRYRVEHIFDANEALLRARIVLAHALVLQGDGHDASILRGLRQLAKRVTPVFVSRSPRLRELAERLDGRFVEEPVDVASFKRAVYRAVSKTQDRRQQSRPQANERGAYRVLLLHEDAAQAAVMAAVLRNQVNASCDVMSSAAEVPYALGDADASVACLIAAPSLLLATDEGAAAARLLARRGIPVVPLHPSGELDVSSAGQLAWDIAPQVRRSLTARSRLRAAG
jgi:FixJ family two-component response regulator